MRAFRRNYIEQLLLISEGNRLEAVRLSGVSKSQFYEMLKEFERDEDA